MAGVFACEMAFHAGKTQFKCPSYNALNGHNVEEFYLKPYKQWVNSVWHTSTHQILFNF